MDDYAKYYYQRIGSDKGDFGDISARVQLRNDLGCKSFQWYLDNIFPELFIPGDAVAQGEVRLTFISTLIHAINLILNFNPIILIQYIPIFRLKVRNFAHGNRTCLDAQGGKKGLRKPVSLYPCHRQGGNQVIIQLLSVAFAVSSKNCVSAFHFFISFTFVLSQISFLSS